MILPHFIVFGCSVGDQCIDTDQEESGLYCGHLKLMVNKFKPQQVLVYKVNIPATM